MFQDKWYRWHNKPVKYLSEYPSNNAWIYTAECLAAGLDNVPNSALTMCFKASKTEYGFHRHPDKVSPPISHDEVIGFVYAFSNTPMNGVSNRAVRDEALLSWKAQDWQICDLPNFKPTPWWKLNWIAVIMAFWAIYQLDRLYKKSGGKEGKQARHATVDFPVVYPIAFHMGGWKRYLIKRHVGASPTIYEKANFLVSKLWTIYSSKKFTPGKRILGFQLKMLQNKTLIEKLIDKLYKSRYNLKDIAAQEYAPGHPILEKL